MIINFSVKNFRSIKDTVTLELNAGALHEHPDFVTHTKYCNVLNTVAIYGLNASGKSNLFRAISIIDLLINVSYSRNDLLEKHIVPFAFSDSTIYEPSEFNLNFIHDGVRYEFGFSCDHKQIYSEWLYYYPNKKSKLLYSREYNDGEYEYKFGIDYKGDKKRITKITPSTALFISVSAVSEQQTAIDIERWFKRLFVYSSERDIEFGQLFTINRIKNNDVTHDEVIKFLYEADFGISKFEIKEELLKIDDSMPEELKRLIKEKSPKSAKVFATHTINGRDYTLDLDDESSGTKRMFEYASSVIYTLKNGGVLVIDELNNYLHPLLMKHIIKLFGSITTNPQRAQLIFTTHETSILTTDLIRRDQVWFCDKTDEQSTNLYSALEFSPRKADNLEKAYLSGRYGAIPIIMD